ncbi:polyphosphate kinase 1 [Paenibacillus sp. RC67]|uniref:polyphosphate kinase 1 n=1 Tax=Paenibacillus sp. RC67 TaxID=3039392 RepID=UPI0024AE4ACA|nr:polyphosphate kinase 1 [Paenibacillus sp. RC67]
MANVTQWTKADSIYINREISWLQFNRRVLQEAQDDSTPLLERIKFLSIVSTNLDEFVSVRAAGIMEQVKSGNHSKDFTGFTPKELLKQVTAMIEQLAADQYATHEQICHLLQQQGIVFTTFSDLDGQQKKELEAYYVQNVFPVLTPLAIDRSRPCPLIRTKSIYLAIVLKETKAVAADSQGTKLALVEIPANLSRFIEVSSQEEHAKKHYILLEDLIKSHIHTLFTMYSPVSFHAFRLTRNADLSLDEEGAEDLLDEMEKVLQTRRWGTPVRLEIEKGFDPWILELLKSELEVDNHIIITTVTPIDLSFFMSFSSSLSGYEHLRYPGFEPGYPRAFARTDDFFAVLRERDVIVMHPYESFEAVNDFIQQAALDTSVLAIKMTLYRSNGDSHIIQSLSRAAEMGKQVTVVVELKARFDEARNIEWAKTLEKAGCHVVYGLAGLKIHAKMTLVVRKEEDMLKRYIHVATGNYNEVSASIFTDIGLFTANPRIGEDVSNLFNEITGFSMPVHWHYLSVAPTHLKQQLFRSIQREAKHAQEGKPARIIAKMNALSNKEMVDQLYNASKLGVQIDLIVRGICCLRPGIPGLSEHIQVRSIVDRFLEHSRIFYFENAGNPQVWMSSADWMTRNLDRRIELMCPVLDEEHKSMLIQLLTLLLDDNVKARVLLPDGQYIHVTNHLAVCRSQFDAHSIIMKQQDTHDLIHNESVPDIKLPLDAYLEQPDQEWIIYH